MMFRRSVTLLFVLLMLLSPLGGASLGGDGEDQAGGHRASPMGEWSVDFSVRNTLDQARGPEYAWVEFGVPPGVLLDRNDITLLRRGSGQEVRVGLLPGDATNHEDGSIHRAKVHFKDSWDVHETKDYTIVFGRTPTATGSTISSSVQGDFVVVNDGPRQYQVHTADTPFKSPQSVYYLYILNGEFRAYGTVLTRVGGNQLDPDQASFQMWWGDRTYLNVERSGLVNRITLRYDDPVIAHWGPGGATVQEIVRYPKLISAEVVLTFYQGVPRVDVHSKKTIHERFWNHNGFVMEFTAIRGDGADWQGEFETVYGTNANIVMTTTTQGPTWTRQSTQWQGVDVASDAAPAFSDLDGDGDLDMVLGSEGQGLRVFENTGDRSGAVMVENATWGQGLPDVTSATPTLGDLDGDGDAELLVGEAAGYLKLYRNDGGASGPPVWTLWTSNFDRLDLGSHTAPNLGDADGDGDLDIVVGLADGTLKGIINTGSASSHQWSMDDRWVDHLSHGNTRAPCDGYSVPFMVDVDYDGDTDLLLGSDDGKVIVFENVAMTAGHPSWTRLDVSHHAGVVTGSAWESNSTPTMVDIDGDGDRDLLIGNHQGRVYHYSFDGNTTPAKGHNNLQPLDLGPNGTYRYIRDKDGNDGPFVVEGYGTEWYDYYVLANPRNGYAAMRYMPDFDRLAYKQEYWGDEFKFAGGNVSYYPYDNVSKEYVTRAQITSNAMSDGVSAGTFISQTGTSAGFVMQPMTAMTYESTEILLLDLQRGTPADYYWYAMPLNNSLEAILPTDLRVDLQWYGSYVDDERTETVFWMVLTNDGNTTLEDVEIRYNITVDGGPVPGTESITVFRDLQPGVARAIVSFDDWAWMGPVRIEVSLDPEDLINETDESNNVAVYTLDAIERKLPLDWWREVTDGRDPSLHADAIVRRDGKLYMAWETVRGEEEIDIEGRSYDPETRGFGFKETLVTDSHYAVEPDLAMKGDVMYLAYSSNIDALRNYHRTAHAKYYWGEKFDLHLMTWDQGAWSPHERITNAVDYDDSHQTPELVMQDGGMSVHFRSTHFQFYTNGNQMDNVPFQDMDLRRTWELGGGGWSSGNRTVGETAGSQAWWGGPSATSHGTDEVWVVYSSEVANSQWDLFAELSQRGSPAPVRERITSTGGANEVRPVVASGDSPPIMVMAYETDVNGNRDIAVRVKRGNSAWGAERLITTDPGRDGKPSIVYDGQGNFWVAWESDRDGDKDIFMSQFDGTSWQGPFEVTPFSDLSEEEPVLACDDQTGRVFLVYERAGADYFRTRNKQIYMMEFLPRPPVLSLEGPFIASEDWDMGLRASVNDTNGDLRYVEWDWGDGNISMTQGTRGTHVYQRAGVYTVVVKAVDWFGLESTPVTFTIRVWNVDPVAFVSGDELVTEDQMASFSCLGTNDTPSDNDSLEVTWYFGDGTTLGPLPLLEGMNVTHAFTKSGPYTVTVTVTDDDGDTGEATLNVTVLNTVPVVEGRALFEELEEDEMGEFSGSVMDTPSDMDRGFVYIWDWGDGTRTDPQLGPSAIHSYERAGTYNATLSVQDDDGDTGTDTVQVVVLNRPPTLSVSGSTSFEEDDVVTLTAEGEDTPSDEGWLEYQWDWGDGSVSSWGSGTVASHTYTDEGNYRVVVTVRDDDGDTHHVEHLVVVDNMRPEARAIASHAVAREGETVHFSAAGTLDTPSDLEDLRYTWDTGTEFVDAFEFDFVFKSAGFYTVTLTVTDDDGETSRAFVDVVVTNTPPVARGNLEVSVLRVGDELVLDGTESTDDPWDMAGLEYVWRMGDGGTVYGAEGRYVYAFEGTYAITLEVTDADGDTGSWSTQVTVVPKKGSGGTDGTDGADGGNDLMLYAVGGGIALLVVVLVVFLVVLPRIREGPAPEDEPLTEPRIEETTPEETTPEEVAPPEPEEVLVEEEVEVLRPKEGEADIEDLKQRIEEDLGLDEE